MYHYITNDLEEELSKRPVCSCCKEHIQDTEYIETPDGEILCNACEDENAKDLWHDWARDQFLIKG